MKYSTDRRIHLAIAAFVALVLAAGGCVLLFERMWLGWVLLAGGLLLGSIAILKFRQPDSYFEAEEQRDEAFRMASPVWWSVLTIAAIAGSVFTVGMALFRLIARLFH